MQFEQWRLFPAASCRDGLVLGGEHRLRACTGGRNCPLLGGDLAARWRGNAGSMVLGNFAKKSTAKWIEATKIFLFIAFPVGFTILQAQPGVMGFVVQDREYVRFPPESEESAADLARIKRTAKIIQQVAAEERASEDAGGSETRGLRSVV